ncbi:MAG: SDR family NAD(P)-dependent oxidoreductase [Planctomycetota bacterium]
MVGNRGFGAFAAYAASKFAVEGLSRSAAQELARTKIRVNTVAPGPVDCKHPRILRSPASRYLRPLLAFK